MPERVIKCPHCNAPLAPSRFARSVVCSYCGATVQLDPSSVSVARYREAHQAWDSPSQHGYSSWCSLGKSHWAPRQLIARGEISDVYFAERARWPTERVLLKVLRDPEDAPLFSHEWSALRALQDSTARGAPSFTALLPQPVATGMITGGVHEGAQALIVRWTSGFLHTFLAVQRAFPDGIEPPLAVWMWRRILEVLSFVHSSGFVHGAVLPQHLLVQENDHGVRLVGYSCADREGARLRAASTAFQSFYPESLLRSGKLTPAADVQMSARCIAFLLGADTSRWTLPGRVPEPLAKLVSSVARASKLSTLEGAWTLRERVGEVGRAAFGPPKFHPLVMPA